MTMILKLIDRESTVPGTKQHADPDRAPSGLSTSTVSPRGMRVIDAAELFGGGSEIALRLGESIYHLRITRLGKLILNK